MRRSADATRRDRRPSGRGDAAVAHAGAVYPRRREAADRVRQRHPRRSDGMSSIEHVAVAVDAGVMRRLQRRHRQRARTVRRRASAAQLPIAGAVRVGKCCPRRGVLTAVAGGCCMVGAISQGRCVGWPRPAVRGPRGPRVAIHAPVRVCAR